MRRRKEQDGALRRETGGLDAETRRREDFPAGPVVKAPHFQGQGGLGAIPGQGTRILHGL